MKEVENDGSEGWLCHFPKEAFSGVFWQALRLVEDDSSISARITRRSSVAEITGKRITSMQASENKRCREVSLRPAEA